MDFDLQVTLDFLRELRDNNNKIWVDAHRSDFDAARNAFERFITAVLEDFTDIDDFGIVKASDCMYRLNRDVRFSPDKSPYKINMSAVLAKGGRKPLGHSYYIQVQPDNNSFISGGMYSPTSPQLERVRTAIDRDATSFRTIINNPTFVRNFGGLSGDQLKVAPQGYPKDHPDIDLLRHKQLMATHAFSDAEVVAPDFLAKTLEVCKAIKPFISYLHDYSG